MKTNKTLFLIIYCATLSATAAAKQSDQTERAAETTNHFGAERPGVQITPHIVRTNIWTMPAQPEKVFPLLCPTREYDWIPSWRAQMIHSQSGVAEENCIFKTLSTAYGPTTWICTRFEPSTCIEYTTFAESGLVIRLKITLEIAPEGTRMIWMRSWYATTPASKEYVKNWTEAVYEKSMERLRSELDYYLRTNTALVPK